MRFRWAIRFLRRLTRILLRTPIENLIAVVLAASVAAGFVTLIEPGFSLRFRRGVRPWKVVPYLCGAPWFRSLADKAYLFGEVPTIAGLIMMTRIWARVVFLPLVAFFTALCNPSIARSLIFLVGLPSVLLSASCRLPRLNAVPGANALLTWVVTTTLVCALSLFQKSVLRWAISDVSVTLYLAVLATVLAVATIQERLAEDVTQEPDRKKPSKRQVAKKACYDLVIRCSLYMMASVSAIWIITASDTSLATMNLMSDADMLKFRRGPFPWECRL